ncbi:hypothetical protein BDV41DRAFT_582832 [Aspergillus transmontanensis]|uniref:FAD dependent oxidoreductase domain-containing protein n=1 Tax=Aspergillus transmontanensis TaxID=1034304 RepID=A0A5N6VEZ9_9EURO|nr:hypothetical protein BDV41DRAFT_582832 [Aspergillus transmontanensis]
MGFYSDGDTKDVNFRVFPSPNAESLYIATAGSGHGFKSTPIIGTSQICLKVN